MGKAWSTTEQRSKYSMSTSEEESAPQRTRKHPEEEEPSHTVPMPRHRFQQPNRWVAHVSGPGRLQSDC